MSNNHVLMTREVATPHGRGFAVVALTAAAALVTGAAALILAASAGSGEPQSLELHCCSTTAPAAVSVEASAPEPPAPEPPAPAVAEIVEARRPGPANADHVVVFELDGVSYAAVARIDDDADSDDDDRAALQGRTLAAIPRHSSLRYIGDDEYPTAAVAAIDSADLPADIAAWRGQRVRVEGGCEAAVSGFEVVSMITGSFDYMAEDPANATPAQRAQMVLEHGAPVVAAVLEGCTVQRGVGRWAELPAVIEAVAVEDETIAERARSALLSSRAAKAAQKAFEETEQTGAFWRSDYGSITTKVMRHPRTNTVYASVQAVFDFECAGAGINLWGLYEVDRSGSLKELRASDAGMLISIERAVDIDGDGAFEFFAEEYLSGHVVVTPGGDVLRSLEIPFFGCSC